MRRITEIIPTPRQCPLAGRSYEVWPATLRDVASLQAWLDGHYADPLDDVWPKLDGASEDERRTLLADAEARAEAGAPIWDEDSGRSMLATHAGIAVLVAAALRRGQPQMTVSDVVEIVVGTNDRPSMTPAEFARLRRAFFGVDTHREIQRLMLGPLPELPGEQRVTWGEIVDDLSRERCWTYPQIYELTLNELGNARRHGKEPDPVEYPILPGQDPSVAWREVCHRLYGKSPEEMFPEPPALVETGF